MFSRRSFVQVTGAVGAGMLIPWKGRVSELFATPPVKLTKYVDALPIPPAIDMTSGGSVPLNMAAGSHQFHRDLLPTTAFGYGGATYLGPTIVAESGVPVTVTWTNGLPSTHPGAIPVDDTLPGMEKGWLHNGNLPAVAHLHGGFTLPQFDGTPLQWFNNAGVGDHYIGNVFTYVNQQRAANLWYHDHALGVTRLNVYAGLAGYYLLRDDFDTGDGDNGLPSGPYEVPLVIQDRIFNPDGSLFYSPPNNGVQAMNPSYPHPTWIPEFFGDTPVVNGKAYPFLDVEPRRYRFRVINGSNARFYNMWFEANNMPMPFHQIGTDQGLLPAPAPLTKVLFGPGERLDLIVDFAGLAPGTLVTLKNNAKAPFPGGAGGAIPAIMQFRVNLPLTGTDRTTPAAQLALAQTAPTPLGTPVRSREIMLKENLDPVTGVPVTVTIDNTPYMDPATETPTVGDTEQWEFINTTGDAHPMHTHLVSFEIVNRQPFNSKAYLAAYVATGKKPALAPYLLGAPAPPAANELGLKDTARAMPGEVLRIKAKFDLPSGPIVLPAGRSASEYVYHCHILEHEENDMMRPLEVGGEKVLAAS